ncbi:MAG TPA: HAMP domain-containing sensor histidine kinase [Saprospiraceae bacterium]|nr:HAMP domain-containing sensor histidine kinase [Saprospiraceae bacterium]
MRFLSYGVMVYMLMALIWWTVLLLKNNTSLYESKLELLQESQNRIFEVKDFDIKTTPEYETITSNFERNKKMILGEGMVFGISLILGLWFIQNAYIKEVENTGKQKNFLLSVTHELRSPIASINLITQTLLKRKLPPEKTIDLHESILSESTRLEKLINNLLLTTRINNSYTYNFESINVHDAIHEVIKNTHFQCPEVNIHTHLPNPDLNIMADKEAFISIINNMVENGIKYSAKPAKIDIKVHENQKNIMIELADEGIGIPENEKSKVTGQFYRVGSEETRETKGTGLGLYIVDKITKAHNGFMEIQNNAPKGSKFIITLPKKQS